MLYLHKKKEIKRSTSKVVDKNVIHKVQRNLMQSVDDYFDNPSLFAKGMGSQLFTNSIFREVITNIEKGALAKAQQGIYYGIEDKRIDAKCDCLGQVAQYLRIKDNPTKLYVPNKGCQELTLAASADIVISGGAAGVGKTFGSIYDALRHHKTKDFQIGYFRRSRVQIKQANGLLDTSAMLYPFLGATANKSELSWAFPNGGKVSFGYINHEKDYERYRGAGYDVIHFDELTHFTEKQFFFLFSRLRSMSGIKPYIRATCNPDAESWVAKFISWWIDEDGFIDEGKCKRIRYFIRREGEYVWGDSKKEVIDNNKAYLLDLAKKQRRSGSLEDLVTSVMFIKGDVNENLPMLEKDPAYLGKLASLPKHEMLRLLGGNWKVKIDGRNVYNNDSVESIFDRSRRDKALSYGSANERYITVDLAGKGRDFFVCMIWEGKALIRTDVYSKSTGSFIVDKINTLCSLYNIPRYRIAIDCGGMGEGVHGFLEGAIGINAWHGKPIVNPITEMTGNVANLESQLHSVFATEFVNNGELFVDMNEFYVDGIRSDIIPFNNKELVAKRWVEANLSVVRLARTQEHYDKGMAGKGMIINDKDTRKKMLRNKLATGLLMSPDWSDAAVFRAYFWIRKGFGKHQVNDTINQDAGVMEHQIAPFDDSTVNLQDYEQGY